MNKRLFYIFLAIAALFPANAFSRDFPFAGGEEVTYVIHYKWGISADIGEFKVKTSEITESGAPAYHIVTDIATYRGWDTFFKVRDRYESKFRGDGQLTPLYFHRDVSEGSFWAKNWFSWENGATTMHCKVDKKGYPHREFTFHEKTIIRDVMNLFYTTRAADLSGMEGGRRATYVICMDKDLVNVAVRVIKREEKKISGMGKFNTIKLGVSLNVRRTKGTEDNKENSRFSIDASEAKSGEEGVFYGEEKIFIWLSDDENRIPLYFSAPVAVGSINGRISSYGGLKYPLSSKK